MAENSGAMMKEKSASARAIRVCISAQLRSRGVTLMELLVTIAILGVLAAIAYPSYAQYIVRANRAAAQSFLIQIADRQEQFFSNNKRYAAGLAALGYAADDIAIDKNGAPLPAGDADRIYQLSLTNVGAATFTVNATPQLRQANEDNACQTLFVTHTGRRAATGGGANCW